MRKKPKAILLVALTLGLGGLSWLLGSTSAPALGLLPFAVLATIVAVLFSHRNEPSERLLRLIKALRRP